MLFLHYTLEFHRYDFINVWDQGSRLFFMCLLKELTAPINRLDTIQEELHFEIKNKARERIRVTL